MRLLTRRPIPLPERFERLAPLASAWAELGATTRPDASQAHTLELATLLLVELRLTEPDKFPTDRLRLLRDLLRELRG